MSDYFSLFTDSSQNNHQTNTCKANGKQEIAQRDQGSTDLSTLIRDNVVEK